MNKNLIKKKKKSKTEPDLEGNILSSFPELSIQQRESLPKPIDGMIKEDDESPTGYSIYKLGQWIHLVLETKAKNKKKIHPYYLKQKRREELERHQEQERKDRLEIENKEIISHIENLELEKKLICIYSGFGYSIVIIKRKMTLQLTNEKSAFQPYEKTESKEFHICVMLRWGTPSHWSSIADTYLNYDVKNVLVSSIKDIDEWVNNGN